MLYTGTIKDVATGKPIAGAGIKVYHNASDPGIAIDLPVWQLAATDTGYIEFDNKDGAIAGMFIRFEAPGYDHYGISADSLPQQFEISLYKKTNAGLLIGIGAALVLLVMHLHKIKKL